MDIHLFHIVKEDLVVEVINLVKQMQIKYKRNNKYKEEEKLPKMINLEEYMLSNNGCGTALVKPGVFN